MLAWPIRTLFPRNVLASPSTGAAKFGGRTLNGAMRLISWDAGGLWRITYDDIFIDRRDQVLAAQALDGALDGGATTIIVYRFPGRQSPDGIPTLSPHSDGSTFSDDTEYASEGSESYIHAAAALGATSVVMRRPAAAALLYGGEDFSLMTEDGPRLHRIIKITDEAVEGDWRIYSLDIRVPLRADIEADAEANFRNPACVMRIANYPDLAVLLERHKRGRFRAEFVEA